MNLNTNDEMMKLFDSFRFSKISTHTHADIESEEINYCRAAMKCIECASEPWTRDESPLTMDRLYFFRSCFARRRRQSKQSQQDPKDDFHVHIQHIHLLYTNESRHRSVQADVTAIGNPCV